MDSLPHKNIILGDVEFVARPGERVAPVGAVFRNFRTKETTRLWHDELGPLPPHSTGPETLFVAFNAAAEFSFYLACGWPLPERILDLYVEFRNRFNCLQTIVDQKVYEKGQRKIGRYSLVGALTQFGLPAIDIAEKKEMVSRINCGGPWMPGEKPAILDYCEGDVIGLDRLLSAMLPRIDVPRALLRGRYMPCVAVMEYNGIPIDVESYGKWRNQRESIRETLIARVDVAFGVYEGVHFRKKKFERWLAKHKIPWPRLPSGELELTDETFSDMSKLYLAISPLRELRNTLSETREDKLAIGSDGRNRCSLWGFSSSSSRNQPSSTEYVFGEAKWKRGFIKPSKGLGLGYIDISSEEFGIAAALSGDQSMVTVYARGDPYLELAKMVGAAPPDATRKSHGHVRDLYKACVLAVFYGMGEYSLAARTGQHILIARHMLRQLRETFPRFWEWITNRVRNAMLVGSTHTRFGWTYHVGPGANIRSIRNFPMQANAAEILRLAICYGIENGIKICGPVHDAVLIEAPLSRLDEDIARMRGYIAEASSVVLGGFELRTDYVAVRYPDRYMDPRGRQFWDTVMSLL